MTIASQERTATQKTIWTRFVLSWFVGSMGAYLLASFFFNFYPFRYQFVVLTLFFQLFCGITVFLFLPEIPQKLQYETHNNDPLAILTLFIGFALSLTAVILAWQFPGLFSRKILFMESAKLPLFIALSLVSLGLSVLVLKRIHENGFAERLKQTRFFRFVRENLLGLLLAMFFLFTYLIFAETINFPRFRTLDLYFDTDISEWLARLTATAPQNVSTVRAVHPAILLFLRPLVWFISIFLNGDRLHAVFLMNALAGATCVLLTCFIVKRASGNTAYALIMASLLGVSAAHLLLSSMLESYIYSALALLFFIFLIQNEHTELRFTIPAGILVFGVTVTNLIQTCILYFFKQPRLKAMIQYVAVVVFISAGLNLLQTWMYPNAGSLFRRSSVEREQYYVLNPFEASWRSVGRFSLIARAIPLYGVVAPTPFILTEELGMDVPNFRTYEIQLREFHVAGYRGLADFTVKVWIMILGVASVLFLVRLFKTPRQVLFPLSLFLCLGFNFSLHLIYGDDPMLYSPDWVYALILFVALAFQRWADLRWFQLVMIAFLILLIITNLGLIHQIMNVSAPFYSRALP